MLANALGQSAYLSLMRRLREQARSHNLDRVQLPAPQCSAFLWELACLRCRHLDTSGKPSRRPHTRSQIDPVQPEELPTLCLMYPVPNVGAGLLANALGQSAYLSLMRRLREQARSHNVDRVQLPAPQCSAFLWELACLRCRHFDTSGIPSRRPHTSSQIDPVQPEELPTLCLMYPVPNVGAGLLANALGQSAYLSLTQRIREQVSSHNVDRV
ncbi:Uncharacterised protein [Pseudomonas fluorescens]|uniref:Uncharacterized protein n=2 Tax=Pseudomonas fluorescens TaxID=294 RepID=A0ABY1TK71_PSEFL|nr:hypothetical protein SAMN04488487_4988 [Pseudomonas fluorescens]SQF91444.1 Uncharacterised protein [Pseudomonas fluorescens]